MRIRMTGVLVTRRQALGHAERLARALEELCFAYEIPQPLPEESGPYDEAYIAGYRYAVCSQSEVAEHRNQGAIFIEFCEYDRLTKRRMRTKKKTKKKTLASISR